MEKSETVRRIYAVALGVFAVAVGIAIICVAADIYYSGTGTGVIYSREIVGARLEKLAIPLLFLVAAIIVGAIFPIWQSRAKPTAESAINKLRSRMPERGGAEFADAEKRYRKLGTIRLAVWVCALCFALAAAIVMLVYLCDTAHFNGEEITTEILRLVSVVMPWTAAALVAIIAASVAGGILAKRQLAALKAMIKLGEGVKGETGLEAFIGGARAVVNHKITLWVVRGVVLAVAVAFIIAGALNGGAHDVLVKAINICQECIGLG